MKLRSISLFFFFPISIIIIIIIIMFFLKTTFSFTVSTGWMGGEQFSFFFHRA